MIQDFKNCAKFFGDTNWGSFLDTNWGSFLDNAVAHCYIGSKYWQKR